MTSPALRRPRHGGNHRNRGVERTAPIIAISSRVLGMLAFSALAALPGLAAAQSKEAKALLLMTSRVHYQLRLASICNQPDPPRRETMAAALTDWLTQEAQRTGVSAAKVAETAAEAEGRADTAFVGRPPAAQCNQNAASLITLSGG